MPVLAREPAGCVWLERTIKSTTYADVQLRYTVEKAIAYLSKLRRLAHKLVL
jgi:hypothetical protein